jgi:DNA-binding GntR family transcriptional regulator
LRDHVADDIRERIIDGEFGGGRRLIERDLSAELEVSRITVREALQQLAGEGFVILLPRRGAAVTPFGPREARNLLELREPLDVLAARLAALRHDADGADRLRATLDTARDALARGEPGAVAAANVDFHEEIGRCTANELLVSHMSSLHGQLRRLFRITRDLQTDQMHDHDRILDAIVRRQPDRAGDLALAHVRAIADATLAQIPDPPAEID